MALASEDKTESITSHIICREMGLSHREFFRSLPAALKGYSYQISDSMVTVMGQSPGSLTITLGPQQERRIAALALLVTQVSFEFSQVTRADIEAFMDNFQRHFQRGGG